MINATFCPHRVSATWKKCLILSKVAFVLCTHFQHRHVKRAFLIIACMRYFLISYLSQHPISWLVVVVVVVERKHQGLSNKAVFQR